MVDPRMGLPWERLTGPARGTGICLSGGGLRAASFGLGVLQALQHRCGLLYGPKAAEYLAAVSGGSYVAAAHTINARRLSEAGAAPAGRDVAISSESAPPPLARGTAEEEHILNHGRYLVTPFWGTVGRFALLGALNLVALVVLFVWTGTMLADVALLVQAYVPADTALRWLYDAPLWLLLAGLVASVLLAVKGLYSDSRIARFGLPIPALAGIAIFTEPVVSGLADSALLGSRVRWGLLLTAMIVLLILAAATARLLHRSEAVGLRAAAANWAGVGTVRACGAVLMLWSAVEWFRLLSPIFDPAATVNDQVFAGVAFFTSLLVGLVFSYVPDRASLHREYRDRIRSCFGVVRDGLSVTPEEPQLLLSQLSDPSGPWPRLLICATANVRGTTARGHQAFGPLVFSHDTVGIPGTRSPVQHREVGTWPCCQWISSRPRSSRHAVHRGGHYRGRSLAEYG